MSTKVARRQPLGLSRGNGDVFDAFRKEMDQMLSNVWTNPGAGEWLMPSMPTADVSETEQAIEVRLDLPGVKPDEIEIHLDKNVLTISGERVEEQEEKGKKFHRMERHTGSFARSFVLPQSVNEDEVAAEYRDGVLNVTLPKTEEAKARKIVVKT